MRPVLRLLPFVASVSSRPAPPWRASRPSRGRTPVRAARLVGAATLAASLLAGAHPIGPALANTPDPASVTIAGDLETALGCANNWDPACAAAHLAYDAGDDVWQNSWAVPAGSWQYKAALNDGWTENYGLNAAPGGDNIPLNLGAATNVKFYYDHKTHWVTDNHTSVIATVPGSFQSQLGCPGNWDPGCLRSWLEDPSGSGTYSFETTALTAGSYEAKAAINESWNENYGQGGVQNGPNIAFTVPADHAKVTFTYNASSHVLTIAAGHSHDNNVEWDGLRHDSRDLLYRAPGGAVPAGHAVTLRFRTFHDDVTSVKVRLYSVKQGGQEILPMQITASDVSCYQAELASETCDFWSVTLSGDEPVSGPDVLWYRFIVADGTSTAYYADDTSALDGGLGATTSSAVDNSWDVVRYDPSFTVPSWASDAIVYQVFPDRFRNGRANNDPKTGDPRYDDPVLKLAWNTKPEGYCDNYADAATNCAPRFGTAPGSSATIEQPRGRDYFGGDLKGLDQELTYLAALGISTIYLNPIFDSASNHGYDTQDYLSIDPYFGTQKDWENLAKHATQLGMRLILDGVFNHLSSDSPFFDRYHHFSETGACESVDSPYRNWFTFHDVQAGTGTCAGSAGANSATYDGWFGFDSIPVLNKSNTAVRDYFLKNPNVAKLWLVSGASGWRLDVMGDASFPAGYWETFRTDVKTAKSDALIVGELWQKDSTLLSFLEGTRADTTMDYRFRDAVLGYLAPQNFDSKGFPDSGHQIPMSQVAARLLSIREDYPAAAYSSLMNLLDSHDTERILWTLTPGQATTADKELNAANLAEGKARQRLASILQFGIPGMPTIYYGDEVAMTGNTDPDDRRPYPWADLGGSPDLSMLAHYTALAQLRKSIPALTDGDLRVLFFDEASRTLVLGRKTGTDAAIVAPSVAGGTFAIPLAGYVPNGIAFGKQYAVGGTVSGSLTVAGGSISLTLPAFGGAVLATGKVDLTPPPAPAGLSVTGIGNGQVALAWTASAGATGYNVYRSPVSGGGYVKVNESAVGGTTFADTGLRNGQTFFYVVRSLDAAGNESAASNEVSAMPHLVIGWANLQWPPTMEQTISAVNRTVDAYGQVWIDGVTNLPGATPTLQAQLGFGPAGTDPATASGWRWVDASFNVDAGNNDEFKASLLPDATGSYDYVYRYSTTGGHDWLYADLNGPIPAGSLPPNPGKLTVSPSADTTAPAIPTGLHVTSAAPDAISLAWDPVAGDPTMYGYEILRSSGGGAYSVLGLVTDTSFADTNVVQDATYSYAVRAVDASFNRSANSAPVTATAELRIVHVTFNVTVPASTDATGRSVYIAGTLSLLDGGMPDWNPGATVMTRVDATHWTIAFSGKEGTQIQYKYALGDWDHVEKDAVCGEIGNRMVDLSYGADGLQTVSDTVLNWRNVSPCGN